MMSVAKTDVISGRWRQGVERAWRVKNSASKKIACGVAWINGGRSDRQRRRALAPLRGNGGR